MFPHIGHTREVIRKSKAAVRHLQGLYLIK